MESSLNNKQDKRKKYLFIIIILLLIILFITSIIVSSKFGKIDIPIPTGNIDIFDINICCDNKCNDNKDDSSMVSGDNTSSDNISGTFSILDSNINWYDSAQLNIFSNYAYQMKNIIAPGNSNTYNFIIRNNNSFPIKYTFKITEENNYNVNMKYRLKQNGKYVIGNSNSWVSYDKLSVADAIVSSKSKNVYTLEWKWIDSNNDNYAGEAIDAIYKLKINVYAEQYGI